jgi:CPA1 family monovalent cation:H+ antiporter
MLVARPSDDHLVEITLTMLAAYGSFLLAEELHVSGVLATLSAGMLVGNRGMGRDLTEEAGRRSSVSGNSPHSCQFGGVPAHRQQRSDPADRQLLAARAGRHGRGARGPGCGDLSDRTDLSQKPHRGRPPDPAHPRLGRAARGFGPCTRTWRAAGLPEHDALVSTAFAVVAFSIFVQGLTVPRLLRKANVAADQVHSHA